MWVPIGNKTWVRECADGFKVYARVTQNGSEYRILRAGLRLAGGKMSCGVLDAMRVAMRYTKKLINEEHKAFN